MNVTKGHIWHLLSAGRLQLALLLGKMERALMSDKVNARGTVSLKICNASGAVLWSETRSNLIVTVGKTQMAHLLAGDTVGNYVTTAGAGTDGTATSLADTTLTGSSTVALSSFSYPAAGSVLFNFTFGLGDANGMTIQEFGLICGDGTLFSRIVRAPISKTSAISIVGTWQIDF